MKDIMQIIAAMLAVLGFWRLLGLLAGRLLYPKRVRERIVAFVAEEGEDEGEVRDYLRYLYVDGKIYSKRLIIVPKCDIIDFNETESAANNADSILKQEDRTHDK